MTKFNTRLVAGALAAVAAFGLTASVAQAQSPDPDTAKVSDDQDKSDTNQKRDTDKTRYCYQSTITGSIITKRICKTRTQWLAQGVDPLKQDR